MQSIFGVKWDNQFPTEQRLESAANEWGIGLFGLTAEQIANGINRSRTECKWPPTIAEFRELAKGVGESWEHKGPAYQTVKALPKPERKPKPGFFKDFRKTLVML